MRNSVTLLAIVSMLGAGACTHRGGPAAETDSGSIDFVRNSEFTGPKLRVFLTLDDGRELSVNTTDDAVATRTAGTPIPGHQARDWTFVKDTDDGTSVAYALVSWNSDHSADYLMAGWWAEFPGQHFPDLSFEDSIQYAIVDGPEIDLANPARLPLRGQATYTGQAGGLYTYVPGTDWGEDQGTYILDEYEGQLTVTADFAEATLSGCIGCEGDLVTRARALWHLPRRGCARRSGRCRRLRAAPRRGTRQSGRHVRDCEGDGAASRTDRDANGGALGRFVFEHRR